jgi:parallel beta-helix repeat protein
LVISNNFVGTNLTGTQAIGNRNGGIVIGPGSANVIVGGSTRAEGNLVSGNTQRSGIFTWLTTNVNVANNLVGTDVTGSLPLRNTGIGIEVQESNTLVQDNVVANNTGNGIEIRDNQYPVTQWSAITMRWFPR